MRLAVIFLSTVYHRLRHITNIRVKFKGWQNLSFSTMISVNNKGSICFGKRIMARRNAVFTADKGSIIIGDYTTFNYNCITVSHGEIKIGKYCSIGPNVVIYDHDHLFDKTGYRGNEYKKGFVEIEDNCWIGANVTILRNAHIGEGSVIGAGTVVKGDIPPHSLVTLDREIKIRPIENRH